MENKIYGYRYLNSNSYFIVVPGKYLLEIIGTDNFCYIMCSHIYCEEDIKKRFSHSQRFFKEVEDTFIFALIRSLKSIFIKNKFSRVVASGGLYTNLSASGGRTITYTVKGLEKSGFWIGYNLEPYWNITYSINLGSLNILFKPVHNRNRESTIIKITKTIEEYEKRAL